MFFPTDSHTIVTLSILRRHESQGQVPNHTPVKSAIILRMYIYQTCAKLRSAKSQNHENQATWAPWSSIIHHYPPLSTIYHCKIHGQNVGYHGYRATMVPRRLPPMSWILRKRSRSACVLLSMPSKSYIRRDGPAGLEDDEDIHRYS